MRQLTPETPIGAPSTDITEAAPHRVRAISMRRSLLAIGLVSLNLADVVVTRIILGSGGREANPLMEPVMGNPVRALLLKTIVSLLASALLFAAPPRSRLADAAVAVVVLVYTGIVGWNLGVLFTVLH
ncbi:MAG: DUF5658 family protein [Microthrixaceae bacterium]